MSVTIRLARVGRKNLPAFKIVVSNTRDKRNGRFIDVIGHFNPSMKPESFSYDKAKYEEWAKKGALPTETVKKLVAGEYKFEPYTRQNEGKEEAKKEVKETKAESTETTEKTVESTEEAKTEEKEEAQAPAVSEAAEEAKAE